LDIITGLAVSRFLNKPLRGKSMSIFRPADLHECGKEDIVWVRSFTSENLKLLETCRPALAICDRETAKKATISTITSDNPRLDFIRILNNFFKKALDVRIHQSAIIEPGASIGNNVKIGAFVHIGKNVSIGDDCIIGSGVKIEGKVTMGKRCVIKANSVLGGQGFGFEYDEHGNPIHFPHLGEILIEDDVWIGACSTVEIGTLGKTMICTGCKVDDLVQIGHNVFIDRNTLIMANSVICGGASIGKNCWIAPNSVIKEKIQVGNRAKVGLGAVVLKNVEPGMVVAGVPAKPLKKIK